MTTKDIGLSGKAPASAIPLQAVARDGFDGWLRAQPARVRTWLAASGFKARPGSVSLIAGENGKLERAYIGVADDGADGMGRPDDGVTWQFAAAHDALPAATYALATKDLPARDARDFATRAALGWALAHYRFDRYRKAGAAGPLLALPKGADAAYVESAVRATWLVRDLINTPAGDMGPAQLAAAARTLARPFGARVTVVSGARLKKDFPAIYAVGRASDQAPRLIDLKWQPGGARGDLPSIAICGKGVCFDTGGLDIKSAAGMLHMKKDMGGGAMSLGLARMIMAANLPVRLRVLIPAVENAVAGNAYHPRDVVRTRKGITVEVGNTDAEGRIVLSDAMALACEDAPDLLIDLATLTGAARVALGTGLPALFCNDEDVSRRLTDAGMAMGDPVWRLPLWQPYREKLGSKVADINNISGGPFGGAITAALFLQDFVTDGTPWVHIDFMGANESSRPGRPEGGEAQGMRALYALIADMAGNGKTPGRPRAHAGSRRRKGG